MARIIELHHNYEHHNYEKFLNNFLDSLKIIFEAHAARTPLIKI